MRVVLFCTVVVLHFANLLSQNTIEETLARFNNGNVPYISVKELQSLNDFILLDTREKEEFAVSRIPGASWVGYTTFSLDSALTHLPRKDIPVVVYCSVGVRSENIGEKLQKAGFTQVKNLYGGIFQWKNEDNTVVDSNGNPTEEVHAYSKHWGKLLTKGHKIYNTKSNPLAPGNE